ncbi:MAG TPA: TonB-dependent receptor, partial [Colwellia sp.]|nr:TonB-dependent receptor [Colwellia sp.]
AIRVAMMFGAGAAAAISAPTFAADEGVEEVERIQVTGSRIQRAEMEGANPVQIITREDLVATGITNIGDILQEIPSVAGAGTNTAINNGGSGAVRVSLRGLGSDRTLVLLNGRRMVASGTGANSSVDLSTIPTAIVKRIEVLKDGASAIYGSDAIAGVVNIITRDDFEGFESNMMYDVSTQEGDGETKSLDFTVGFASDKGNAVVSAYYTQQGAQWSGDRDWSAYELDMDFDGEVYKGGSSAPPWGRYNGIDGSVGGEDCGSFTHGAGSGPGQSDPSDFSNPTGYDCWDWDKDTYNYAPANYHLTPQERYGMFASGRYEFNDNVNFFTELSFSRRQSDTKLAPLPLAPLAFFGYSAPYSADNYYNEQFGPKDRNGASVDIADWRRRMVETGGRDTSFRIDTVRAVIGFEGQLTDNWAYEVSYIYGANDAATNGAGGVNFEKVATAVGPSFMNDDGGVVCGTEDDPIAGCTSLNVFGTPGTDTAISQEMMDYITFDAHDLGSNEQQIISLSVFGDAFELPAGSVGVAFGVEHREENGADFPDALIALGITSGSSRLPTEGGYTVDEAYLEANFPILSDMAFAKILEVDVAVRYSDYDSFGDTTNGKLGLRWMPLDGLMLRSTVSTAFRAPSTGALFAGSSDNSPTVEDPCANNPTTFCVADGVPAAGFEPIGDQLSSTRGGSTEIQPEEADILTVGVVYSPNFIDGLSLTVDYWDIELTNAISTIGEQLILTKCASEGTYCDKITRYGSSDGTLYGNSKDIDDRTTNVGGVNSSGLDFNINYSTEIASGTLRVNLDTTYYATYDKIQADDSIVEHAGRYWDASSGDGNFPDIKSNLNLSYAMDDWSVAYAIRYMASVEESLGLAESGDWSLEEISPDFRTEAVDAGWNVFRDVGSSIIHDARFTYYMDNLTATVGIDNLFDKAPPFMASGFNDNTDPRSYNTTGRHAYISLGVKF